MDNFRLIKRLKLSITCYPDYVSGDQWYVVSDLEGPYRNIPLYRSLQKAIEACQKRILNDTTRNQKSS